MPPAAALAHPASRAVAAPPRREILAALKDGSLMAGELTARFPIAVAFVVVTTALLPVLYSYVLYRRLEGFGDDDRGHAGDAG